MVQIKWPAGNGLRNSRLKMGDGERPTVYGQKKIGEKKADANDLEEDRGNWQGT